MTALASNLTRATAAEFAKVFSLKAWWLLGLIMVAYVGMTAAGLAFFFSDLGSQLAGAGASAPELDPVVTANLVYSSVTAVGLVILLLFGALLATTEYRHGTLTPTVLAQPRRGVVLAAKGIVAALMGALYGVMGLVGSVGLGAPVLAALGESTALDEPEVIAVLMRTLLATALWSLLGLGLGALLTSQIAAIVIVLAFTQFVEPILRLVANVWEWSASLGRFLPGAATDALVGAGLFSSLNAFDSSIPASEVDALLWWQGGVILAALAAVLLVAASLTTMRRDVE
ncbi:ABC transporter permease [Microcella sp.]|uniref:ABC transporter permease n=1 Tax=Microcella sp. TaxID=1913979 RepID=UPI00255DFC2B|nr:ABC transporter permease [Microcella sp.]MBX9471431.1 ABC transporter permease [Microcella sp.]